MASRCPYVVMWELVLDSMASYLETQKSRNYDDPKSAWVEHVCAAWGVWRKKSDKFKDKKKVADKWIHDFKIMETLSKLEGDIGAGMSTSYVHHKCIAFILSNYQKKPNLARRIEDANLEIWLGHDVTRKPTNFQQSNKTEIWTAIDLANADGDFVVMGFLAFLDIIIFMSKHDMYQPIRELARFGRAHFVKCWFMIFQSKGCYTDEIKFSIDGCIEALQSDSEDLALDEAILKLINQQLRIETIHYRKKRCERCSTESIESNGPNLTFSEAKALFSGEQPGVACSNCNEHLIHTLMLRKSVAVLTNKHGEGASNPDRLMSLSEVIQQFGNPVEISPDCNLGLVAALCSKEGNLFAATFRNGNAEQFDKFNGYQPLLPENNEADVHIIIFGTPITVEAEGPEGEEEDGGQGCA